MKQLKKTLLLCTIFVFVIAAVFALPACKEDPKVESISVEIIGGGEVVELEQKDATVETIKDKITVVAQYSNKTTETVTDYTVEGLDAAKVDTVQTLTVKYGEFTAPLSVKVKGAPAPEITVTGINVTIDGDGDKVTMQEEESSVEALKALLTVTANKSDNSTQTVTDYEVIGLDVTKVDEDQTVTVKYSGQTATVTVVIESTPPADPVMVSITVSPGSKITLQPANATEAAILAQITVTGVYDNGDTEPLTTGLTIVGFDATKTGVDQLVTVKYGELTSYEFKVYVEAPATITAITATYAGDAIELIGANATTTNIINAITNMTATYSDKTTKDVDKTQCVVTASTFNATKYGETQQVEITYGETKTTVPVKVVQATPVSLEVKPELINVSGTTNEEIIADIEDKITSVKVIMTDDTKVDAEEYVVKLATDFDCNNFTKQQTATIFVSEKSGELTCDITVKVTEHDIEPEYEAILKVGNTAQGEPTVAGNVYTWTVTLSVGDVVTISDNKSDEVLINGAAQYTATRSGEYTFAVTPGDTETTVEVTVPEYAVTLKVTRAGEVVNTQVLALSDEHPDDCKAQYYITGLELYKNDVVAITDNDGITHSNYQWCNFNGTATRRGNHDFYVKVFDDSTANNIYVAVPELVVTLTVNNGEAQPLELDTAKNEFFIKRVSLQEGATVVIKVNGEVYNDYKDSSPFKGTDATAGDYDFYVRVEGDDKGIYAQPTPAEVPPSEKPVKIYFYNHGWTDNWAEVYAYCWNDAGNNAAFPGEKMTDLGDGWFVLNVAEGYENVIFKGNNQTGDLKLKVENGVAYYDPFGEYTETRPTV